MCRVPGVKRRICSNQNKAPSLGSLSSAARSPWVGELRQDFILHLRTPPPPQKSSLAQSTVSTPVRGGANWGAGTICCLAPSGSLGTSSGRAGGQRPAREAVVRVVVGGLQWQKRGGPQHLSRQILSLVVTHQHLYGHFLGGGRRGE